MSSISADSISTCANCGKGEENGTKLKTCTACKLVKYCNRECQIAHRPQHKKECRIRAGEMLVAQGQGPCLKDLIYKNDQCMEISDEELFQQPPPKEDCPICFLPMPHEEELCGVETVFQYCCGKRLCIGCCMKAGNEMDKGNMKSKCPFCNVRMVTSEKELLERCKARMKLNDANAYRMMGVAYRFGSFGLPQDWGKALEMWVQAAELGSVQAHADIAHVYVYGLGVKKDKRKVIYHSKLAAIGGHEGSRHNLGTVELTNENILLSMKHNMISAKCGNENSLNRAGKGYKHGYVTKDEYDKTLREYKNIEDTMKSEQRTKAAAVRAVGERSSFED